MRIFMFALALAPLAACSKKPVAPEPLAAVVTDSAAAPADAAASADAAPSAPDAAPSVPDAAPPAPDAAPPAPDAAAPDAAAPDATAGDATAAPSKDAIAQCEGILKKAWTAIQPALKKLEVPDPASLEQELTQTSWDSKAFLEKCPLAPKSYRDCIAKADNPLELIRTCQWWQPEPKPEELPIPRPPGKSPLLPSAPITKAAGDKLLAQVVGTWEGVPGYATETWTIAKDGKVEITRMRDGKPEDKTALDSFSIGFVNADQMVVHYGGNDQTRSFFLAPDGKTFYSSGNLMWSVYPTGDGKTFVARQGFDWLFVTDGKCEVVTAQGSVVPATCAFADRDGGRFFDLDYQVPGQVKWGTTEPEPTHVAYTVFGDRLLAPDLVRQQAFKRK